MELCSNNHEELCYECYECPLCAIEIIKETKIEDLMYEISRLETELNMAKQ